MHIIPITKLQISKIPNMHVTTPSTANAQVNIDRMAKTDNVSRFFDGNINAFLIISLIFMLIP